MVQRLVFKVASPSINIEQTVSWKDGIVKRLTTGVGALLKRMGRKSSGLGANH